MAKLTKRNFEKQYCAALATSLQKSPLTSLASAHSLGKAAASLQFDRLDLARMHGQLVARLIQSRPAQTVTKEARLRKNEGKFLYEALAQIERAKQLSLKAGIRSRRLTRVLQRINQSLETKRLRAEGNLTRRAEREKQLELGLHQSNLLLAASRRMQSQSRRLARRVLSAQEDERKEISRDLHDEVAQTLAGINVQLAALKETATSDIKDIKKRISKTQRLVSESVQIVHRFARDLRPTMLDDIGLIPALRAYIRDLPKANGLSIHFTAHLGVEKLTNLRRTVLYRVVQEALKNVVRHARASLATVSISKTAAGVRMEISDNGRSFSVPKVFVSGTRQRLGILGMRERVEMVGGALSISSSPSQGTTVQAEIPNGRLARRQSE